MKSLIISKNSRIIRSIEKLADFDLVSHTELDQVDLNIIIKYICFRGRITALVKTLA